MMRACLIALLLMQALVAQAGIAGISCMHGAADSASGQRHGDQVHVQAPATSNDMAPAASIDHDRCCCDYIGHCSSSAIDSEERLAITPVYPLAHGPQMSGAAVMSGFEAPPYRPPSPSV